MGRDVGRNADDDGVLALRTAKITNDEHVTEPGSRQLLVVVSAGMSSGKLGHGGSQGDIEVSEAKWSSLLEELKLSRTDQSVKGSAGGGGRAHRARRKAAILTPGPNADPRHIQCAAVF